MYTEYTIIYIYIYIIHISSYMFQLFRSRSFSSHVACFPFTQWLQVCKSPILYIFIPKRVTVTSTKSRDPWLQGILINGGTMTHLLHQPQTGGEFSPTTNKTINGLQLDFNPTGVYILGYSPLITH